MIREYFVFISVIVMINANLYLCLMKKFSAISTLIIGSVLITLSHLVPFHLQTQMMMRIGSLAFIVIGIIKYSTKKRNRKYIIW